MNNTNGKLKIVTFVPMPPIIPGGIEEYAYSVVESLRNQGLDVIVVTSKLRINDDNNNSKYSSGDDGYVYVQSAMLFKRPIPLSIFAFFRIFSLIIKSDIIHMHSPYPFLESFAAIVAKLFGKKIVITYHMDTKIDATPRNIIERILYPLIEKSYTLISLHWALLCSDVICTNTLAYAKSSPIIKRHIKKIKVIYQGIRKDRYDFFSKQSAQLIREKYLDQKYSHLVTFIGRLIPYKGLEYLIEAIHLIGRKRKVLLVIGGDGPQKEYLINLVKKYNLDNVIFVGFVKDEDLFNLIAVSDVFVTPSISMLESAPIMLLSALAVGTPVIGTSIGGTEETIPNDGVNGIIVPPKDSKALAEAIIRIIDNPRDDRIKITFKPRFWSDVAKEYAELFYRLCNKKVKNQIV